MLEFIPLPDRQTVLRATGTSLDAVEAPVVPPGAGQVVFRTRAAAVAEPTAEGMALSPVGEVAAADEGVRGWEALDRAVLLPDLMPGAAPTDLPEWFTVEPGRTERGVLRKLPLEMPSEDAALLGAVARAERVRQAVRLEPGDDVVVAGLDFIPLLTIVLARHHRAGAVIAADPSPTRRRRAEYSGASSLVDPGRESLFDRVLSETGGKGVSAVVLGAAEPAVIQEAAHALAPGGRLVLYGGAARPSAAQLPVDLLRDRELRVTGVRRADMRSVDRALATLREGLPGADTLVSRRVSWAEASAVTGETWAQGLAVMVDDGEDDTTPVL